MGMFDFLKKKPHKREEPQAELWNTRDINKKLEEFEHGELQKFYAEVENIRKELGPRLTESKNLAIALEKSKIAKGVDSTLIIRIESARRNLVSRTKNYCDFFFDRKLKPVDSLESLNKLLEVAMQIFSQLNDAGSKYAQITALGFNDSVAELESSMKGANELYKKLVKRSEENKKKLDSISELKSDADKITLELKKLDDNKAQAEKLNKENKELNEKEAELLNKKEKLESSSPYKNALILKERLESAEKEKETLKKEFRNEFLMFKKPIQKYLYSFGAGLSKDLYARIEEYLDEPMEALAEDTNIDIESVLSKICEFTKDDRLEIGPKEKICSEITKIIGQKKLHNAQKKYKDLEASIIFTKDEIAKSIINDSEKLSKEIEALKSNMELNNRRIEVADKAMAATEENINRTKIEIEKLVGSEFKKRIRLD